MRRLVSGLLLGLCLSLGTAQAQTVPAKAIFAGGCFWCMEPPFDKLDGVIATISGYTGGTKINPTYEEVSGGRTGHAEAVEITYDPAKVSYEKLLEVFWHNVDPLDGGGQFCDRGPSYRTAVFVSGPEQRKIAEETRAAAAKRLKSGKMTTQVLPLGAYWLAEEYHRDFAKKNAEHYTNYRTGCGRDRRLAQIWGTAG